MRAVRWWLLVALLAAGCASTDAPAVAAFRVASPTAVVTGPTVRPTSTAVPTTAVSTTAVPITAVPITEPSRAPIVLGFAGDTAFTNGLDRLDPFDQVTRLLQAPDLMVVNLETAVADPGVGRPPVEKRFLFRSPPESLDLVVDAGIDVVALANNHVLDFGVDALAQTLDEIDARSLRRVGAGLDESSAYEPLIVDVGDWTVGLVSLSRVPCDWSAPGENVRPQVAWACPTLIDRAEAAVAAAREASDVVIVMIHGGEEGVLCPSPFMSELSQSFADMGVDAVINGHPHVLQGIARRGQTWVANSLGNFAFPPARGITGNSAIVQLHVAEDGVGMSVVPVRSDRGVLSVPTAEQRTAILDQVDRHSDAVSIDDSGIVRVDPAETGVC